MGEDEGPWNIELTPRPAGWVAFWQCGVSLPARSARCTVLFARTCDCGVAIAIVGKRLAGFAGSVAMQQAGRRAGLPKC